MRCVPAHHFTVAKARSWRSSIDDDPVYQRAGDVWTVQQQQRFIDSLLNGFDVPKIYLHDLRGVHPRKVYAIVDGKQRLTAIWSYLADGFPLARDFRVGSVPVDVVGTDAVAPTGPLRFSGLDPAWQRLLLGTFLSVVLIRDASEADIDELFARLNSGTPLTDGERRNAMVGDMSALVRQVAALPPLGSLLPFPADRGAHREVAAALLALEDARRAGRPAPDLSISGLDAFVRDRPLVDEGARAALLRGIERGLGSATRTLDPDDPRLSDSRSAASVLAEIWATLGGDPVAGQADPAQRSNRTG